MYPKNLGTGRVELCPPSRLNLSYPVEPPLSAMNLGRGKPIVMITDSHVGSSFSDCTAGHPGYSKLRLLT